jgi:hypothetical protein
MQNLQEVFTLFSKRQKGRLEVQIQVVGLPDPGSTSASPRRVSTSYEFLDHSGWHQAVIREDVLCSLPMITYAGAAKP